MDLYQFTAENKKSLRLNVLSACLYFTNLAAVVIYILLRIVFFDYDISIKEDIFNLLTALLTATSLGIGLYFAWIIVTRISDFVQKKELVKFSFSVTSIMSSISFKRRIAAN